MSKRSKKTKKQIPPSAESAWRTICWQTDLAPIAARVSFRAAKRSELKALSALPDDVWAVIDSEGTLRAQIDQRPINQWLYVLRRLLMHLALDHFDTKAEPAAWSVAAAISADAALQSLPGLNGVPPERYASEIAELRSHLSGVDARSLYNQVLALPSDQQERLKRVTIPEMSARPLREFRPSWIRLDQTDWVSLYGRGLRKAVLEAMSPRGSEESSITSSGSPRAPKDHPAQLAREWFIASYPLLGSLIASYEVIVDPEVIRSREVDVAMVDSRLKEIYLNDAIGLSEEEMRFVIAHEILHVGLRHTARCEWRDPIIWNAATDYQVNGWLVEMGVGTMPRLGLLYDPKLVGIPAEEIYERLTSSARRYRKLAKKRGVNLGDLAVEAEAEWRASPEGADSDTLVRSMMLQGLARHVEMGRGLLPAGLEEEITALAEPPIPWDVELADWLDGWIPPLETRRSFARPSRRQSATPDIPRPSLSPDRDQERGRVFGVILDTSLSMDSKDLARALGAISSYAESRDVGRVRVVFCDAQAYDAGWLRAEEIAGRVRLKGRGGTVLQPAVDLLNRSEDFPGSAPILIITDGWCDRIEIKGRPGAKGVRESAFLLTSDGTESFHPPAGSPVFKMRG